MERRASHVLSKAPQGSRTRSPVPVVEGRRDEGGLFPPQKFFKLSIVGLVLG